MEVPTNAYTIEILPNEVSEPPSHSFPRFLYPHFVYELESIDFHASIDYSLKFQILSLIFEHLDFHSLLTCCLVCYRWFALVNEHRRINRKLRLRIDKDYVTDIEEAPDFVRSYSRVHLKSIQFTKWPEFADNFPEVEELKFSRCEFGSWCFFVQILVACSRVSSLDLFDTVILEDHDADSGVCSPGFEIRSACLTFFDYHALKMLNIFEAIGLRFRTVKLKLMGTSGFEDLRNLFDCIEKSYGDRLTEFTFLHNMSPEDNHRLFEYLAAMKRLHLEAFTVDEVPRHSGETDWFEVFLQQQRRLKKFELTKSVTAEQFESITIHLTWLTELRLTVKLESSFCSITRNLSSFKRLKVLALTIEKFQNEHELVLDFLNDLGDLEQLSFEAWRLNTCEFRLKLPESMNKMKTMMSFSIRTLPEFWFYQLQMDDGFVQELIKNMPNLVELHLYKISGVRMHLHSRLNKQDFKDTSGFSKLDLDLF
jgi:F-box-like